MRKTTSGLSSITGSVGMNPMAIPAVISKTGYGILTLSAMAERPIMMVIIKMTIL
ncbi:hypothetical protein D3C87_1969730 [compost metagenome]